MAAAKTCQVKANGLIEASDLEGLDGVRTVDDLEEKLKNRIWRLNNLYWITTENAERVKFKLNRVQMLFYGAMWWLNIILKSRQHGLTTFICIFCLDLCLFNSNIRAGMVAHTRDDAELIFYDKIKYPYDNLPKIIRDRIPPLKNDAGQLRLANNSSIRVGTSLRSGTYQFIHVSEHGKICAKYPEKAKEIKSGTLEAIHEGGFVFLESTAEGKKGDFADWCKKAEALKAEIAKGEGVKLTKADYKFHFYAWYQKTENIMDPEGVVVPDRLEKYFEKLRHDFGIELNAAQKAWYVKKEEKLGDLMFREHPSTPEEAFRGSVDGAYYASKMAEARREGRIARVPYDPAYPVFTAWDLGIGDAMAIWFFQLVGNEIRLIEYYENNGHGFDFYAHELQNRGYVYAKNFGPHDLRVKELNGLTRLETAAKLGIKFEVVPKISIDDGIQAVRSIFQYLFFDKEKCEYGIECVENYTKKWNDSLGIFDDTPLHNWASHCADALRYLAVAYKKDMVVIDGPIAAENIKAIRRRMTRYSPMAV